MNNPSLWRHLRDILLLPFTMSVVVPYFIYKPQRPLLPAHDLLLKVSGLAIGISGIFMLLYTISLFGRFGKGSLAPWSPTQKLVVVGPYRYCRNPMITGVFFILTGEACFFNSTAILWWAGLFFIINTIYFILKEEPDLERRFGEEYRIYKQNVPRWIPKIRPYKQAE
ncbi:MAG TPA: isoprenylcysteine carboxylmethyltransferase family protein [Chryseolinea sp.]|nr:isoprenylcysteine carboxylmethyltransferase family protein [Chryseolinea sp.]